MPPVGLGPSNRKGRRTGAAPSARRSACTCAAASRRRSIMEAPRPRAQGWRSPLASSRAIAASSAAPKRRGGMAFTMAAPTGSPSRPRQLAVQLDRLAHRQLLRRGHEADERRRRIGERGADVAQGVRRPARDARARRASCGAASSGSEWPDAGASTTTRSYVGRAEPARVEPAVQLLQDEELRQPGRGRGQHLEARALEETAARAGAIRSTPWTKSPSAVLGLDRGGGEPRATRAVARRLAVGRRAARPSRPRPTSTARTRRSRRRPPHAPAPPSPRSCRRRPCR